MAGHLLVLLAMGLQARYVLLDARGLLPARRKAAGASDGEPAAKGAKAKKSDLAADDTWVAVDSPHGSPQPILRRTSAVAVPAPAAPAPARRRPNRS